MTEQQVVLSWLKDAHALEVGALPTLQHHADTAQNYPEVREKLLQHVDKTRHHAELIEGCLERLGTHPATLKEAVGATFGRVTGLANLAAKDPVIKNALGDYAAEHFEIASYKSLIAAAEKLGDRQTADVCRQILQDEEEMAGWLGGHIPTMTQKFLAEQSGESESSGETLGQGGTLGQVSHDVGQSVTELGEKGKDAASNVSSRNALLAGGALLAGAGAALLISRAINRSDADQNSEQTEWNDLGEANLGSAEYGVTEADGVFVDDMVVDDMVTDDIAYDTAVDNAVMDAAMESDGDLDDQFIEASDPLETEPLEIETDAATMSSLDDAALLADLASDPPAPTETDSLIYTEVWLEPGLYSGFGPQYDSAGDPVGQEVASRLTQHGRVDASAIEITVENGDVLLEGTVADEETKRLVGEAVQTVPGVNQIENMLQVQTVPTGVGQGGAGQQGSTGQQSSTGQENVGQSGMSQTSRGQAMDQGSANQGNGGNVSDFEHSTKINASPDEVYAFMSKVENLPKYLPTTHSAQPQQGDRVRVQGEAQGHEYDADGFFRTDKDAHRIEWGADEQYYSGWLEVTGQGDDSSMTVHLSFSGGPPAGQGDAPSDENNNAPNRDEIQEGLVKSLESIKNFVEEGRSGGKEEPSAAT